MEIANGLSKCQKLVQEVVNKTRFPNAWRAFDRSAFGLPFVGLIANAISLLNNVLRIDVAVSHKKILLPGLDMSPRLLVL